MDIWLVVVLCIASFLLGHFLRGTDGVIHVNTTNPKKDIYRFELNDLKDLETKRLVTFRVDHNK